jgi:hypothetical protein
MFCTNCFATPGGASSLAASINKARRRLDFLRVDKLPFLCPHLAFHAANELAIELSQPHIGELGTLPVVKARHFDETQVTLRVVQEPAGYLYRFLAVGAA